MPTLTKYWPDAVPGGADYVTATWDETPASISLAALPNYGEGFNIRNTTLRFINTHLPIDPTMEDAYITADEDFTFVIANLIPSQGIIDVALNGVETFVYENGEWKVTEIVIPDDKDYILVAVNIVPHAAGTWGFEDCYITPRASAVQFTAYQANRLLERRELDFVFKTTNTVGEVKEVTVTVYQEPRSRAFSAAFSPAFK